MSFDLYSDKPALKCPKCNSEALYRYGKTRHGKQRYRCLLCGRQFGEATKNELKKRPLCPACGRKMHIYRKGPEEVRFRCSVYPTCRTFLKLDIFEYELLLSGDSDAVISAIDSQNHS